MLFKCRMGVLQGHGSHTPLQDEGETPMMDLVKGAADPIRIQRPEARVRRSLGTCRGRELRCRFGDNRNRNRNRQLSMLIVNIETDAQSE